MTRPNSTVLFEALIIGIINMMLIYILKYMKMKVPIPFIFIISGALIHLIFEYTGGNEWWCRQTYKIN